MKNNTLRKIILILILLVFVRCESRLKQEVKDTLSKKKSVSKTNQNEQKAIDAQMALGDRPDNEQESPSAMEERQALSKTYDQIKVIDTLLIRNNDTLKLHLKYYCLKNKSITVPKTYFSGDEKEPKDFKTYDFASSILLTIHGNTVFDKVVKKSDFNAIITEDLRKYGSLRMPYIAPGSENTNQVILHYSVSIPVTDIGEGVNLIIDKDGKSKTVKD